MRYTLALFITMLTPLAIAAEVRDFPNLESADWKDASVRDLPKSIDSSDFTDEEGLPIKKVQIRYFDFNLDGNDDLLVAQGSGGTGSSIFHLYTAAPSGYVKAFTGEGGVVSLGRVSGKPQLEVWTHSGGNDFSATRYAFTKSEWIKEYTEILRRTDADRLLIVEHRDAK
jgi:hypothetical protein